LGQHKSTQRKAPHTAEDKAALTADIVELAKRFERYGNPLAVSHRQRVGHWPERAAVSETREPAQNGLPGRKGERLVLSGAASSKCVARRRSTARASASAVA
jgi:hypothetical protein